MSNASNKENVAVVEIEAKSPQKAMKTEAPSEEDIRKLNEAAMTCSIENKEACMMCSS